MKSMYPHPYPLHILILNIVDILEKKDYPLFSILKSIDLSVGFSLKSDFETTNKQDKAT